MHPTGSLTVGLARAGKGCCCRDGGLARVGKGSCRREGVLPQGRGYCEGWSWVDDATPEAHGGVVSKAGPIRLVAG